MKQTLIEVIDHHNGYIELKRFDGKKKVIPEKHYRLLRILKSAGIILAALLAAVLFCGAAVISEHPAKWLQTVILFGISAFILVAAIVLSVTGGEKK